MRDIDGIDVSDFEESRKNDNNEAEAKILCAMVESKKYAVENEYGFIFNGINADDFVNLYITPRNRADVSFVLRELESV